MTPIYSKELDELLAKLPYGAPSEFSGEDLIEILRDAGCVVVRKPHDNDAAIKESIRVLITIEIVGGDPT